jgi:hypothetical protein
LDGIIQPNSTPKIHKFEFSIHVQCKKSKKIGFYELKNPIQSNNPIKIQKILLFWIFKIERGLNIHFLKIFEVVFGKIFNHPSNPIHNSGKKLAS